jgi:hypothetical protein
MHDSITLHSKPIQRNTLFVFRGPSMINVITSNSSTRFWFGFFPDFVFGHLPIRKLYRAISTGVSMTLHATENLTDAPFIFCLHRMIKGVTSTWSTRFWLGFFPDFVFGHLPTRNPYHAILTADSMMTLHSKSIHTYAQFIFFLRA